MYQVFLEKPIKYQVKKWISKKVFIFYFRKVLKPNFADKEYESRNNIFSISTEKKIALDEKRLIIIIIKLVYEAEWQ